MTQIVISGWPFYLLGGINYLFFILRFQQVVPLQVFLVVQIFLASMAVVLLNLLVWTERADR